MKTIKYILVTTFVIFLFSVQLSMVQAPPPPNGNNAPEDENTKVGGDASRGSAPTGSGLFILMAMGVGYGAKKVYNIRNRIISNQ